MWAVEDEYCAACSNTNGYPDIGEFGAGAEFTYHDDYYTDSYSYGAFDATNQYDQPGEPEPEEPSFGLYEEEYFNEPSFGLYEEEYFNEPAPEPVPEPSFGLYEEEYFNEPEPSFGLYEEEYFDY